MKLKDCKLYYGGQQMSFDFISDDPCRARYASSIPLPLAEGRVDVYEIEPGAKSRWIVVKQRDGDKEVTKLFVRRGKIFLEDKLREISKTLRKTIEQKLKRCISHESARVRC